MEYLLFECLVAAHIVTGVTGAIAFWVPVVGKKGGEKHRRWGRVFTKAMLITGSLAVCMSVFTLVHPMETHPHLVGRFDADFIRGIFGWMMLHMGVLTINLAWYGWLAVKNGRRRERNREWRNLLLQPLVILAALNCALQGWLIDMPLMMGISVVGVATGLTNLWFLYKPNPGPMDWLKEHLKALVGGGISVYTAFMAFGSVRIIPELALNPVMWAIPLTTGIGIILYHWRKIDAQTRARAAQIRTATA
ncbi:hypothetical protein [Paracraurococcus ruber]|uniref:DUF2306 domain-containing protein n=1 Tax=Paracraurococcus ruber TaxID=77675 RepID=A0ABS1CUG8_9PROT|nr:hypothetical protein [Paracraurococcus ruber]MBK1658029.1 hypothetical protein [Paracraurococcus ruber]TDG31752.1 hypothetical protein E2C05_09800 [Paracraurococcus ruber]